MGYKFLLTGIFLLSTCIVKYFSVLPVGQSKDALPAFSKSTAPFWELGKQKDPATDTASLKQSSWYGEVMNGIAAGEYHFKWQKEQNAYCTPNRKNNLRFFYNEVGFSVEPRTTQIPIGDFGPMQRPDEIKYKQLPNWKINFNLDKKQVGKGIWQVIGNKAEYVTDNITVQYINNEEGMRQNFIVQKPLTKNDELKINFSIKTKLKYKLNGNQLQFFHRKINVLNYEDLKVWDAEGKTLAASFKNTGNGKYFICVDTKEAIYPITIDPISTTPNAIIESNQQNTSLGFSVASAGDVNGDGYSDVIVGAPYFDNVASDQGAAYVYHGSAAGITTTAATTLEGGVYLGVMGFSVASAGDVNGDGYSDVIVGARGFANGQPWPYKGAAFVHYGSASGISVTAQVQLEGNQVGDFLGISVAGAGDVNGDGYSDIIVGVLNYTNGQSSEGAAFVYHGSATGINATVATILESNQSNSLMGTSVAPAGDVNGDGFGDIIVGAYRYDNGNGDEGAAFVYHGSASGIIATIRAQLEGNQNLCYMGYSVASAGDVNGDGYSDVIVGAYYYDNGQTDEGAAFVFHGSATGINTTPVTTLECNQATAHLGYSVASAGDVNGDGYSDVIVGAILYDNGEINEGAAFVYHGSAIGINAAPVATLEFNQASAWFGNSVASAGDVNGDGYSDIIVGADEYSNGQNYEGAAFVYHGSAAGINISPTTTVESNQASANMGFSVAGAGDVNADGYSDVIVGARDYDNGHTDEGAAFVFLGTASGLSSTAQVQLESNQANAQMGCSVSGAGDVNGDGYSDVIVGANQYNNPQNLEGSAFVYHGSASGITTTVQALLESNQVNAKLGSSVAAAGDVNGDGFGDVIVGAPDYTNGEVNEGAFFLYHGSSTGINSTAILSVESNQALAQMGWSVTAAGDVNGDGYGDVAVGAYLFDNGHTDEGAVFVYHGSSSGVSAVVQAQLESNKVNGWMGYAVSGAGDVNGDGYSDLIAGSLGYDNGQINEGAAFVYHGGASGIISVAQTHLEYNQFSAQMGNSVASAGDVNGDGYSDVIVGVVGFDNGSSDEGGAFIYHGSVSGISTVLQTLLESNQVNAQLGYAVACAGDVNGDGYSDVIVGANQYDNGQANEGAAFIYHGNSPGTNKRNNIRLYNQDLITPIQQINVTQPNLFGAGLFAKSPLGRVKGKLVWEVKKQGVPFSGNPITTSVAYLDKQTSFTDLGIAGIELKNNVQKVGSRNNKIRARVEYDKATAITGQVYGPWRYPPGYTMGAYGMNSIPLPVTLLSFTGRYVNASDVQLNWITTNEIDVQSYYIERSSDGTNFAAVGTTAAKGQGGNRAEYAFTDNNVTVSPVYYRLRVLDKKGDLAYTRVVILDRPVFVKSYLAPNPVSTGKDAELVLQSGRANLPACIWVYNGQGQLLQKLDVVLRQGSNTVRIATARLPAGQYFIKVAGNGVDENFNLLVQ